MVWRWYCGRFMHSWKRVSVSPTLSKTGFFCRRRMFKDIRKYFVKGFLCRPHQTLQEKTNLLMFSSPKVHLMY
jgi:hypothetical protein